MGISVTGKPWQTRHRDGRRRCFPVFRHLDDWKTSDTHQILKGLMIVACILWLLQVIRWSFSSCSGPLMPSSWFGSRYHSSPCQCSFKFRKLWIRATFSMHFIGAREGLVVAVLFIVSIQDLIGRVYCGKIKLIRTKLITWRWCDIWQKQCRKIYCTSQNTNLKKSICTEKFLF